MFIKIIILCAAAASFLYTFMYAVVSNYYRRSNGTAMSFQRDVAGNETSEASIP